VEYEEKWKPFIVRLPKELKKKLRLEARKRNVNIAELIRQIIISELEGKC